MKKTILNDVFTMLPPEINTLIDDFADYTDMEYLMRRKKEQDFITQMLYWTKNDTKRGYDVTDYYGNFLFRSLSSKEALLDNDRNARQRIWPPVVDEIYDDLMLLAMYKDDVSSYSYHFCHRCDFQWIFNCKYHAKVGHYPMRKKCIFKPKLSILDLPIFELLPRR